MDLRRREPRLLCIATLSVAVLATACATVKPEPKPDAVKTRVERAQAAVPGDPRIEAQVAAVDAARAREESARWIDEFEVRVGDDYSDSEHQVRLLARVPINRPSEVRAQRKALAAETRIEISRLEDISHQRRAELCFPSIAASAAEEKRALYKSYRVQRRELLTWNEEWRRAGTVDELRGARFEIESRIRLASWRPEATPIPDMIVATLPPVPSAEDGLGTLDRNPELVRVTVARFNPSVAVRRATAERYRALAARANARNQPWIKFVDLGYEHSTGNNENGVRGQVAIEVPLGGDRANARRYQSLVRREDGNARGIVMDLATGVHQALAHLDQFEAQRDDWIELLELADRADEIAERWWKARLVRPRDVGALLDEAFVARNTVLEAREQAGAAYCSLLALSGVEPESWPRVRESVLDPKAALGAPQ